MRSSTCRTNWENGLWDGDDGTLAETGGARGSHFYNGALKTLAGQPTTVITYLMGGVEQKAYGNARVNAQNRITKIQGMRNDAGCYQLGLALHYLTDQTQPMHSSSFSAADIPLSLHPTFEDYVGNLQGRYPVTTQTFDGRFAGRTPDQVFHEVALKANSFGPALEKTLAYRGTICTITSEPGVTYTGQCFLNDPAVNDQIGILLHDAYQSTASYIYSVFKNL